MDGIEPNKETGIQSKVMLPPRNLNYDLNRMNPAEKSLQDIPRHEEFGKEMLYPQHTTNPFDTTMLPPLCDTPRQPRPTEEDLDHQLSASEVVDAQTFKETFGNPGRAEPRQSLVQAQLIQIMRREAAAANGQDIRDREL